MPVEGRTGKRMFTVSNRDVILQISIAVLICIFLFPRIAYSQKDEKIKGESEQLYSKTNVTYDSYENYLPGKNNGSHSPEKLNMKAAPGHSKQSRPIAKKKTVTANTSKRYISYAIRKGDTLTAIAKKHGVTVSTLRSVNKLSNHHKIKKGMTLKIPLIQASSIKSGKKDYPSRANAGYQGNLRFQWPIKAVIDYHNDGLNGVKSIGIIITGKPGSTVLSSASGTVRKIGRMRGFGNYIVITHPGRYSTVYSNLESIMVSPGDTVPAGNAIGKIGSTEIKMHFQIDREGKPEDPLRYLPRKF